MQLLFIIILGYIAEYVDFFEKMLYNFYKRHWVIAGYFVW